MRVCECNGGKGTVHVYIERIRYKLDEGVVSLKIRRCWRCKGVYYAVPLSEWAGLFHAGVVNRRRWVER